VLRVPGDLEGIALSPDGKRVAFIRDRQNASALFLATLGSTAMRQVTPWSLNAKPKLDWSPDGKLILARTDDGRVFTIRPDGSGLTVLTKGPDYCSESFSPDGTKVLFVDHCSTNGLRSHIYSMNADGTGVTRIPGLIGHWVSWGAAQT
jgi:Tol biopolymer transport system component